MATQGPGVAVDIAALSAQLLENREVCPRARILAQAVTDLLLGTAANIYLLATTHEGQGWAAQATSGDVSVEEGFVPIAHGTLGTLASNSEPVVFSVR